MADLEELIERVESGTGADRAIDGDIAEMFNPDRFKPEFIRGQARRYTTSLDAVIALIEEKLPGWVVAVVGQSDDRSWWAELRRGYLTSYDKVALSRLRCASPARALCAAFLKAHKEQHDG